MASTTSSDGIPITTAAMSSTAAAAPSAAWSTLLPTSTSSTAGPSYSKLLLACLHTTSTDSTTNGYNHDSIMHPLSAGLFALDALSILRALQAGRLAGTFVDGELDSNEMLDVFLGYLDQVVSGDSSCLHWSYTDRILASFSHSQYLPTNSLTQQSNLCPFPLSTIHIPSLDLLGKLAADDFVLSDTSVQATRDALTKCAEEAMEWLSNWRSTEGAPLLDTFNQDAVAIHDQIGTLRKLLQTGIATSTEGSTLPEVDASLMATISQALSDARSSISSDSAHDASLSSNRSSRAFSPTHAVNAGMSGRGYNTAMKRWILASLLKHYLGDEFGQRNVSPDALLAQVISVDSATDTIASTSSSSEGAKKSSSVRYAKDDKDDAAIRKFFSSSSSSSTAPGPEHDRSSPPAYSTIISSNPFSAVTSVDSAISGGSSTAGVDVSSPTSPGGLEASLQADLLKVRRDDKLRWLLGEAVPQHASTTIRQRPLTSTSMKMPSLARTHSEVEAITQKKIIESDAMNAGKPSLSLQAQRYQLPPSSSAPKKRSPAHLRMPLAPHRRAFSTGSVLTVSSASPQCATFIMPNATNGNATSARPSMSNDLNTSFDDLASVDSGATGEPRDSSVFNRSTSLYRVESIDTMDSRTRLLSRSMGHSSNYRDNNTGRQQLETISDHHSQHSEDLISSRTSNDRLMTSLPASNSNNDNGVFSGLIAAPSPDRSPPAAGRRPSYRRDSASSSKSDSAIPTRSNMQRQYSQQGTNVPVPLNANILSKQEKSSLVRKNKKLRAVLGEALDEGDSALFARNLQTRVVCGNTSVPKDAINGEGNSPCTYCTTPP